MPFIPTRLGLELHGVECNSAFVAATGSHSEQPPPSNSSAIRIGSSSSQQASLLSIGKQPQTKFPNQKIGLTQLATLAWGQGSATTIRFLPGFQNTSAYGLVKMPTSSTTTFPLLALATQLAPRYRSL